MWEIRLSCEPCICGPSPSNAVADRVASCSLLGGQALSCARFASLGGLGLARCQNRACEKGGQWQQALALFCAMPSAKVSIVRLLLGRAQVAVQDQDDSSF